MKTAIRPILILICALAVGFSAAAADKISIVINQQVISAYRTSDLNLAIKDAVAAHKPIAWIASAPKVLDGRGSIGDTTSRGATLHAFYALRSSCILVFEDAYAENHKVLGFIDDALHTPDPHYTPPTVLFLDSNATNVIAKVIYEPEVVKRAQNLAKALQDIKGKY